MFSWMQALKEAAEVAQASIELNKAGSVVSCNAVRWPPSTLGQDKKEKKRPSAQSTHLIADVFHLFQFYEWRFFTLKLGNLARQQHLNIFKARRVVCRSKSRKRRRKRSSHAPEIILLQLNCLSMILVGLISAITTAVSSRENPQTRSSSSSGKKKRKK